METTRTGSTEPSELPIVRKLTRKRSVLHDADRLHSTLELANPDGPEAAQYISELVGSVEEMLALIRGECPALFRDEGGDPLVEERAVSALSRVGGGPQ